MVTLTIDGQTVSVPKGTTVYTASTQLGIKLPIFCYQDRMPPFGACRVCMVEVDKRPKPQTSCTLEATEGMVVRTQSTMAVEAREQILEFLLINHPLDCPICDRAGECPLQDQTLEFGPGKSRFYEEKRHFKKPIPLGPVLMLDRERCIACARCTRFCDIVSGDHALELVERGYRIEVATPGGTPARSKFIGNTIEICPVGALTSNVYRFKARPWDNHSTESTCTLCPVGCSVIFDERDGEIMRTRSCENRDVNDMWLCDKGWFGYEFTSQPGRLQTPLIRKNGELVPAGWDEAIAHIVHHLSRFKPQGKLAGFGGNPLTVEENYLFQRLMRRCLGVNHVDHRIGSPNLTLEQEYLPPGMESAINTCDQLSSILFIGCDITETYPVIWLRLKQAIDKGAKAAFFGHYAPEVAKHLKQQVLHAPGQEMELLRGPIKEFLAASDPKQKGAIFVGSSYLNTLDRRAILEELLALKRLYPHVSLNLMEGTNNAYGARFAGMHPELEPGAVRAGSPGMSAAEVIEKGAMSGWDYLHVAGADPAAKMPLKLWHSFRDNLRFLVVQDLFLTETASQADVVLPTLSYVEKEGSFLSIEGRMQRINPSKPVPKQVHSDGTIFAEIAEGLGMPIGIDHSFRQQLEVDQLLRSPIEAKAAPAQPQKKQAGSLTISFAPVLFDRGIRMKHNPHLLQESPAPEIRIHPKSAEKYQLSTGDLAQVSANGHGFQGTVRLSSDVAEGVVVVPLGYEALPVRELGVELNNGIAVEVKRCT